MRKITITVISLLFVLVFASTFINCKMDSTPEQNSSLYVRFSPKVKARTLDPTLELSVSTYDIIGTGPGGKSFAVEKITTTNGLFVLKNLVPGNWTVVAKGRNVDDIIIVQSVPTTINLRNGNNELSLTLVPLTGTGTFNLELSWPVDLIGTPRIVATLIPDEGEEIPIAFTMNIDGLSASMEPMILERGYYLLNLKLTDAANDDYLWWAKNEYALIFASSDTSKSWVLTSEIMNVPVPQNLGLVLNVDTKSPIIMVLAGVEAELGYGTNMTVTASGTPGPTTWKWFLDGDALVDQTTSSLTLGGDLDARTLHFLSIVGRKGDISGSADAIFRIGSAPIIISPVDLKSASDFVILAQSGISGGAGSSVTGNIGVSPITSAAITGFSLSLDSSESFSTSDFVTGNVYASDYKSPAPEKLELAVLDSDAAYIEAASRTSLDVVNDLVGEIGGMSLAPGLYTWDSAVSISTDITLVGPANAVWLFQIGGSLTETANTHVFLTGGALPENVFWQVAGGVTLGASAHMEGVILSGTGIVLGSEASVHGRLYAKTAVTLDTTTVLQP